MTAAPHIGKVLSGSVYLKEGPALIPPRAVTIAATIATVAFAGASTSACDLAPGASDTRDIVIAADLELSGATTAVGTAYRRALELKIDQINLRGVLGSRKLRLRVTDNRSDRSLALTNIAGFANDPDVTAIITGACADCLLAAAPTLNERRIPTFALAPAHGVVNPVADRRYIFKLAPNPNDGAAALVTELDRAAVRTVGLLMTDDEYGKDGREALGRELQKAGIPIRGEGTFKPTDTDLGQVVSRVAGQKSAALVIWTYPAQAAAAAVAAREANYEGRLYLDAAAAGDLFLSGRIQSAAENAILISSQTMAIDDVIANTPAAAARKQWFRDYTARYGGYFGYASYAADAVQLIVDAIETVGSTNRDRIRDVLETSRMDGLSGPIRITPDNHSGLMPQGLAVLVARSGRWRLLT